MTVSFLLIRKSWKLFFKSMTGTYLAAIAALLGCFMKTDQPPVFSGRMGLQIACLFAAIINHRDISNTTGQKSVFMLPDALHVLTYVLIFISLVLTLRSRGLSERNKQARACKEERRITVWLAIVFLGINVALIWGALAAPQSSNTLRLIEIGD